MMPGSITLVQIISTVHKICNDMQRMSNSAFSYSVQSGTEAIAALKNVAGILIIRPVKIRAWG